MFHWTCVDASLKTACSFCTQNHYNASIWCQFEFSKPCKENPLASMWGMAPHPSFVPLSKSIKMYRIEPWSAIPNRPKSKSGEGSGQLLGGSGAALARHLAPKSHSLGGSWGVWGGSWAVLGSFWSPLTFTPGLGAKHFTFFCCLACLSYYQKLFLFVF